MSEQRPETFDGLGRFGPGTLAGIAADFPALLHASDGRSGPAEDSQLSLESVGNSPPGHRALVIRGGGSEFRLSYSVPTPEISGGQVAAQRAASGAYLVHWPLAPSDWQALADARAELIILENGRALFR